MVELLMIAVVGFLVGLLARAIMPGRQGMGILATTLVGIAGSVLAGIVGQTMGYYKLGEPLGFVGAVLGALVVLFLWNRVMNR